jgi:hypothetical protein
MTERIKAGRARTSKKAGGVKKTSQEKVRAHRAGLRAKGFRPVTLWVPDIRSDSFKKEARRQCLLANRSPFAAEDQAWVDEMIGDEPGAG